jgi:SAM-dependent methyltransferase
MVMNDPAAVEHFHLGGGSNPGMQAVYDFGARALDALLPPGAQLLDLGVGSGRALSAVLRRRPDIRATAVDLAPNMLSTARELFIAEGLGDRVELVEADITALPDQLTAPAWDGVSCMWTLHQLPDLGALSAALRQIAAVRRRCGAAVWISDFQRLRNPRSVPDMLTVVDPRSPEQLRNDAIASEAASFTSAELTNALASAGLGEMTGGHARPLPYLHAYWLAGAHDRPSGSAPARRPDLSLTARRESALLRWGFTAKPF